MELDIDIYVKVHKIMLLLIINTLKMKFSNIAFVMQDLGRKIITFRVS